MIDVQWEYFLYLYYNKFPLYLIYNEDDLNQIRHNPDAYYLLKNDITLTEDWIPIGTLDNPFRGGFDGGNHTIADLRINDNTDSAVGLFGYVKAKYSYKIYSPNQINYNEKSLLNNSLNDIILTFKCSI